MTNVSFRGDLPRLKKELKKAEEVFPVAAKYALNTSAFQAQTEWRGKVRAEFTNRNKFTERSIQVDQAKGNDIDSMFSRTHSVAGYLKDQEEGEKLSGTGESKPIPRTAARSGGSQSRLVSKPNKISSIHLGKRPSNFRSKAQEIAAAIRLAHKDGNKFVFLDTGDTRAIYRLSGGKRKIKMKTMWDLSKRNVTIKPTNMLERSVKDINAGLPELYSKALRFQFRKAHILGY